MIVIFDCQRGAGERLPLNTSPTLPHPTRWGDGVWSTIMLHHKLIAGEHPGTYLLTALVNEDELLTIASQTDLQT